MRVGMIALMCMLEHVSAWLRLCPYESLRVNLLHTLVGATKLMYAYKGGHAQPLIYIQVQADPPYDYNQVSRVRSCVYTHV